MPNRPGSRASAGTISVCAIIVTYQPDLESFARLVQIIRPQVATMIVVANSAPASAVKELENAAQGGTGSSPAIHIIANEKNIGIGAAHNQGIGVALAEDHSHVLLLDQDSTPATDMVARLLEGLRTYAGPEPVAAAGPMVVEAKMVRTSYFVRIGSIRYRRKTVVPSDGPVRADLLIASGCLIPVPVLRAVGQMDDALFIDRVDTEWCLRALASGRVCIGVPAAQLQHSIGHQTVLIPGLGREVVLHSPLRHYYAFRNSILVMKRPYVGWAWRRNELILLMQMLIVYLSFAPERGRRLRMITTGIVHGLTDRAGPLEH